MGKMDRGIEFNFLLPCFRLLALCYSTVHKACPYMAIVGSIPNEDAFALPFFLSRYVIYLWGVLLAYLLVSPV